MRTFIVPLAAAGAFSVGKNSAELIWGMVTQQDRKDFLWVQASINYMTITTEVIEIQSVKRVSTDRQN
jgi:hypothetical protein